MRAFTTGRDTTSRVSVSVVSHGHGSMVTALVNQLLCCAEVGQVIVTRNILERLDIPSDPRLTLIDNATPKGFGANHNAAFKRSQHSWFVVLNPDAVLLKDPFEALLRVAASTGAGVLAPRALTPSGGPDDNWRRFPTIRSLVRKAFGGPDGRYEETQDQGAFKIEWASGFFLTIRSNVFEKLGGFDERYFMYYEDVDFCARAWRAGFSLFACPDAEVIHDARRASRRNLRHLRWHLASMARYFINHMGRLPTLERD